MHTPILFTGINTEQAHDIGFPSLEATLLNNVKLSRICRHFGFAMATGGRKPVACSKKLIFSHLVNFGRNFPSSLLRWQNGLGTAWPGREPEVKRPESVSPNFLDSKPFPRDSPPAARKGFYSCQYCSNAQGTSRDHFTMAIFHVLRARACWFSSLEPGPTLVDMVTTGFGPGGQ